MNYILYLTTIYGQIKFYNKIYYYFINLTNQIRISGEDQKGKSLY